MHKLSSLERKVKKVMTPKDNNNYRKMHGLPMHRMAGIKGERYKLWHYGVFS